MGREMLVVLNKIDLIAEKERVIELRNLFAEQNIKTIAVSALTGEGLDALKEILAEIIQARKV